MKTSICDIFVLRKQIGCFWWWHWTSSNSKIIWQSKAWWQVIFPTEQMIWHLFSGRHAVRKFHKLLMSLKTYLDLKLKIVTTIMKIPQVLLVNSTGTWKRMSFASESVHAQKTKWSAKSRIHLLIYQKIPMSPCQQWSKKVKSNSSHLWTRDFCTKTCCYAQEYIRVTLIHGIQGKRNWKNTTLYLLQS